MAPRRPRQQNPTQQRESERLEEEGPPTGSQITVTPQVPIGIPGDISPTGEFEAFHPQPIERDPYGRQISGPTWNYFEGDEWEPASWANNARGRQRIKELQRQLAELGILEQYRPGFWDDSSAQAYRAVLGFANTRGIAASTAIRRFPAELEQAEDEIQEFAPLITRLTPTEDLRRTFREASTQLTGQGWSREQVESAIASYHERERQMQLEMDEAQYDRGAGEFGPGGEVEGVPTPESFIEARIREQDPMAIPAHDMLSVAQDALGFLSSPPWGRGLGGGSAL